MARTSERRAINRTGICINEGCEKAKSKEKQVLRAGKDFVCEECGKELREVRNAPAKKGNPMLYAIIGAGALVVCGATSFIAKVPASLWGKAEVEEVQPPVVDVEPEVIEEPVVEPPKPVTPKPTSLSFSYGKYVGDIKGGKANGQGKMTYTTHTLISPNDRQKRYAEAGQYVIGTWYDNKLDFGKLYDAQGNIIATLTIGRSE